MKAQISQLINKYGEARTKAYLIKRYGDPQNLHEYASLFPNHILYSLAPVHREIYKNIPYGGLQAYAAPRGSAKSTSINVIGISNFAIYGKYHFILLISDTYDQAKLHLGALKSELESNHFIHWLYGNVKSDTWGEEQIIVRSPVTGEECLIMARGQGMKVRGLKYKQYRPDLAVIDDLENLEIVYSAERRKKLERWFKFDLIPALSRPKNIIYLGTLLHYYALLKKVIDGKDIFKSWKRRIFKAIENGRSYWPEAYSIEYLTAIRDDPNHPEYVGSIVFAQEYQNEPQDDKDRIIKLAWIKEYSYAEKLRAVPAENDVLREKEFLKQFIGIYGGVDPAIGEKETSDSFSFYTYGITKSGDELQLDLIHGKFSIDEQVRLIIDGFKKWRHTIIGIESNAYQSGLNQLVRREAQKDPAAFGLKTRRIITDKDKIRRARIHSSAFEGGFVYLRTDHPNNAIIRGQIEEFPLGEHDDAFDSLLLAREARKKATFRASTSAKPKGF